MYRKSLPPHHVCNTYWIDAGFSIRINYFCGFHTGGEEKIKCLKHVTWPRNNITFINRVNTTHLNCFSQYSLNIVTRISRTIFAYPKNRKRKVSTFKYKCQLPQILNICEEQQRKYLTSISDNATLIIPLTTPAPQPKKCKNKKVFKTDKPHSTKKNPRNSFASATKTFV